MEIKQLSIDALERIDEICCRFERDLKTQKEYCLTEYLQSITGPERATLLLELIALDIDYRCRRGEPISPQDYTALFPHDRHAIETAFSDGQFQLDTKAGRNTATQETRTPDDNDTATPERIDRYRILNTIASGGAGVVYRGFDEELQRDVAIKVPHRNIVSDGQSAARFLTEARLVASLNHRGIVPVYDVGRTDSGQCYVVSKLMEGGDLRSRIKSARPSFSDSAMLVAQIAEALSFAHKRRLVHRDIKPSNLLTDSSGAVYVADFGAAIQEESSDALGFVGTPAYMSPEQARGESHRVDARTDIFALGIVLYELLTGQRPFQNQNVSQLLADVIAEDPVPPRQIDPEVPVELERICLKAMSKRAAARYQSALELAKDLGTWSDGHLKAQGATSQATVIPKGLRSFDANDAEFFLQLLPGPRDRESIPESIRFWRSRIEDRIPELSFLVGVIYGPSGCGKSSLVKAGLLPSLGRGVLPVYIEARADSTEFDLARELKKVSGLQGDLPEIFRMIRSDHLSGRPKILIVIDQFEQWLHAQHDLSSAPFVQALRQCDGIHLQCLLMVRDDFWMPLVRFMAELEVPLVEHENTMAVDLFDRKHAEKVLIRFGQAFDRLPQARSQLSRDQTRFLNEALSAIQQDGTVSPIRLSLFAEMIKRDPWEPATLRRVGGADGLGVTFLNRFFSSAQSLPANRLHADAARNVLRLLLPDSGIEIRGHVRSEAELLASSGYQHHPARFRELIQILDNQLRLVTPTELTMVVSPGSAQGEMKAGKAKGQYYQLTHDFMLAPIREWVTQRQRETIRGRAELCLAERASLWKAKPEARQLPGLLEWLRIRLFTDSTQWSALQRKMLRRATRRSLIHMIVVALSLILIGIFSWHARGQIRAKSMLTTVRRAHLDDLLEVIGDVQPLRRWLTPLLEEELAKQDLPLRDRRNMSLTILKDRPDQASFLCQHLFVVDAPEHRVIRDGIDLYGGSVSRKTVTVHLWNVLRDPDAGNDQRLRAAAALARLDRKSPNWERYSDDIVTWLVANPISQASDWLNNLRPLSPLLLDSLERAFLTTETNLGQQTAAIALAYFLRNEDDFTRVVGLIKRARPSQIPALAGSLKHHGPAAIALLRSECEVDFPAYLERVTPDAREPPTSVVQRIQSAAGIVTKRFALCQTLPIEDVPETVETLLECHYRPLRLRPFRSKHQILVAGIWIRDLHDARVEIAIPAEKFAERDAGMREQHLGIQDLAAYYSDQAWHFIAVWSDDPNALLPTQVATLLPRAEYDADFHRRIREGYQPFSFQHAPGADDQEDVRRTQIWRRPQVPSSITQWSYNTPKSFLDRSRRFVPRDASLHVGFRHRQVGAIWENGSHLDCEKLLVESPEELLSRWQAYYQLGLVPVAISVSDHESRPAPRSLTVWRHGLSDTTKPFVAARSNMITSLLLLGDTEGALPFFRQDSDPSLRSSLIQNVTQARIPFRTLRSLIENRSLDADVRQALILALGNYAREAILPEERPHLVQMLRHIFKTDSDSGVHSASEWAMKSWNVVPEKVQRQGPDAHRAWYVAQGGQTMVILDYPKDWEIDSAVRAVAPPPQHRFAISSSEVTVEEFAKIFPEHRVDADLTSVNTCPANKMDWYKAAEFCNLLSEAEGLPESEWCYQKNKDGNYAEGMSIATDFLKRRGYRLALTAEWMYAASAGARTPFAFGGDDELLAKHGWVATNSRGVLHPVGTLQPNLFGMFDMYGNVKEWGHDLDQPISDDVQVVDDKKRCVLGGCFIHFNRHVVSNYAKHGNPPALRENRNGFRIARTIPAKPSD